MAHFVYIVVQEGGVKAIYSDGIEPAVEVIDLDSDEYSDNENRQYLDKIKRKGVKIF